jgi:MoxR-like ATPase
VRDEIRSVQALMERGGYVTDRAVATALYLAMTLRKPLLIEGRPGVGKTEAAKVLAEALGTTLIRLQCYEGLDASTALYEWNYPKQLLRIRLDEGSTASVEEREASIFSEAFLLKRPLLQAITQPDRPPVLLVDEVDRSDEEFEAFLLEVLSDYQVTIPEIGTVRATHVPHVVLTSNRSRELSEALRRRCLYLWVDYPALEQELLIVRTRVADIGDRLSLEATRFVQALRTRRLVKVPGVAETLDWSRALVALQADQLDAALIEETLGCFLKDESDLRAVRAELAQRGLTAIIGSAPGGEGA